MPSYSFRVRTPDCIPHLPQQHDLPGLSQALAVAQRTARIIVRRQVGRPGLKIRGSLDIENAGGQLIARVPLADVARAIS